MWCLTEELHAKIRIIHVLEKSLENLSKQHDEEMQQNSQKANESHLDTINVHII